MDLDKDREILACHGFRNLKSVHRNLCPPKLYEHAIRRSEGVIAHMGPLVVRTGKYTGRTPRDRFIVQEPSSEGQIWWGEINKPFDPEKFEHLLHRLLAYFERRSVFVQDCYVGAEEKYRVPLRVITEHAWQSLFAYNMFLRIPGNSDLDTFKPEFVVIAAPNFEADPAIDGTASEAFILIHLARRIVIIGGTGYGGEIKKSIFTIMNYLMPQQGVFPMHCSANVGRNGRSAVFFGLSGTGKTSLSADPNRALVGDDEHGWTEKGVFNFEGGCYAKVIRLSPEAEPQIYKCTRMFGTILENVIYDEETRMLDLDDASITENTRAAFPIHYIDNALQDGRADHPTDVVMLTCDAFGVLPPIAKLTVEQAVYHFLSGYTAKVAGTEAGIVEPVATFSTCFGAPFMILSPLRYAELLREKIELYKPNCWLINTGWIRGPYGVGERIPIRYTRSMVTAALDGMLENVPFEKEPYFGLYIPRACPEVPDELLRPYATWENLKRYEEQVTKLKGLFRDNFRQFAPHVEPSVRDVM
ncbi:phosphoenolpyruvate carboxykinase (ATP) [Thermodesulforhabdus norvegica]|uniref:Phosphoenolpyruvate carboxykinase (ATP) n=1 Tax=Thermodesulforhabdus norvegica TaxID=39841 RepID=A0A1I4S5E7_9BACT|nr:phosphoenolpyruvate carboxykinase (ATP) [Thermodesulforhabdus norvegica]SFM59669.1 phosphoenolpyruvate carboxykinase (ATP) [Thermodesulforhabdus norvegica]